MPLLFPWCTTHSPAQHDLGVADSIRGWNMRPNHWTVCLRRACLRHLVRLRGNAVGALTVHVHGYHPKLIGGSWVRNTTGAAVLQYSVAKQKLMLHFLSRQHSYDAVSWCIGTERGKNSWWHSIWNLVNSWNFIFFIICVKFADVWYDLFYLVYKVWEALNALTIKLLFSLIPLIIIIIPGYFILFSLLLFLLFSHQHFCRPVTTTNQHRPRNNNNN